MRPCGVITTVAMGRENWLGGVLLGESANCGGCKDTGGEGESGGGNAVEMVH